MRRGAVALGAENADEAEAAFNQALKADPSNIEAKRLMADVHILRGDFRKAEEQLDALWKEQGFGDDDSGLDPDQKAARELMQGQYRNLYKTWAEQIDASADPELFRRVIRKGLEYDEKSVRLNTLAVQHFIRTAERLVEEGKKAEAAAAYEAVLDFRATKPQREQAEKSATELRKEAYSDEYAKRWEAAKQELIEAEAWNEEKGVAVVTVEADVDRSLRGNNPDDVKKAQAQSAKPTAIALRNFVIQVAGLAEDADFSKAGPPAAQIASTDLRRGKLKMVFHLTPAVIRDNAFAVLEAKREADAAKKDASPDKTKAGEKADGAASKGADAGNAGDTDAGK
jgi:tetratricopeptide (TPR) repeat protein